jgi:predicted small lipoprotein YifL
MKHLTWILAAGATFAVAACGQKGPLYLPDKNASVVTRPAEGTAPQPAPQQQTPQGPTGTTQPAPQGQTPQAPAGTTPKQPQDKDDGSQQPK